ncbi:MAG: Re/Si-specific NAD(P)(+) transhydrogenase subunit alpha [Bacteroidales bacterium]|nr:Re/Si-specific NAD(P)(+) transhydrogenase subunit alpha [Bacteroidales bacterium]MBN2819819.1 Re/Si-specific NAD(P)(+) transhydrogenase subunit alpha [Bacteroidales bacterium]
MKLGVLKEQSPEKRVVLMPESVKTLVALKAEVLVEKGAGARAFVDDKEYTEAGAKLVDRKTILAESDVLLKIDPFSAEDIKETDASKVLLAAMNPFSNIEMVTRLAEKKITSFSLELVPRISRAQSMDILSSMATVAGYRAVLDAALHLPRFFPMFMSAAGTIKPAKVLILGAGVAGLQAIAIARKLGAVVEVFDVRSAVKEEVKSLGGKFIEVEGATEDASAGGYAVEQTEDFKQKQSQMIQDHAVKSDVVICTAQIPGRKAPVLLKKETVEQMKGGSVIIDLAASTGGNCELTKNDEEYIHNGVTIIGNSAYASDMQIDASSMFGKNVVNLLKLMIDEEGNLNLDFEDDVISGTCLTHGGEIKNERVKSMI